MSIFETETDAKNAREQAHRSVTSLIDEIELVPRAQQDAAIKRGFVWGQWLSWQSAWITWYNRTGDYWTQVTEPWSICSDADRWIRESKEWRARAVSCGMFEGTQGHEIDPVHTPSSERPSRMEERVDSVISLAKWGAIAWVAVTVINAWRQR